MTFRNGLIATGIIAAVAASIVFASGGHGNDPREYSEFNADCTSRGGTTVTDEHAHQYLCVKRHAIFFWAPIKEVNG